MASAQCNTRWGLQRNAQLCNQILNEKLSEALQYAVRSSIYEAELTFRELTTAQSLLLSLIHGLLHLDVGFCLNLIEASSSLVQLRSSYLKVWLRDDFFFTRDDIATAFSNLAKLMNSEVMPSDFQLPKNLAVAFSGLIDKYQLIDYYCLSEDKEALALVTALNSYLIGLYQGGINRASVVEFPELFNTETISSPIKHEQKRASGSQEVPDRRIVVDTKSTQTACEIEENVLGYHDSSMSNSEGACEVQIEPCGSSSSRAPSTTLRCLDANTKVVCSLKQDEASSSSSIESVSVFLEPEVQIKPCGSSSSRTPSTTLRCLDANTKVVCFLKQDEASSSSSIESVSVFLEPEEQDEASGSSGVDLIATSPHPEDDIKICLESAVSLNDHTAIVTLLESGLNVNDETESGQRLLHIAVSSGCVETVTTLLNFGANPDWKNKDFITPLRLAVQLNNPTIIETLLKYGANINQQLVEGNSLLHEAASKGSLEALQALLKSGAFVDFRNNIGYTALHLATKANQIAVMQALIAARAAVNILSNDSESCLHIAVAGGNLETIKTLLVAGADPYQKQSFGLTSLHIAPNKTVLDYLISCGVNVNATSTSEDTLLHLAAIRGNVEFASSLISSNAIIDCVNKDKNTPLLLAVHAGHVQVVSMLISAGAKVNYRQTVTKDSALHWAADKGRVDCVRLLLDAGANVNMKGGLSWRPIHNAAENGHVSVVSLLIERGADVNVRTKDKDTPLHWAAYNGFRCTAELLLDKGADINARGDDGDTPLKVATDKNNRSVVNLLRWRGGEM